MGTFGSPVARELARFGNHVTGIDKDDCSVAAIVDDLDRTLIFDAREEQALRDESIETSDVGVINITVALLFIVSGLGFVVPVDLHRKRNWKRLTLHSNRLLRRAPPASIPLITRKCMTARRR